MYQYNFMPWRERRHDYAWSVVRMISTVFLFVVAVMFVILDVTTRMHIEKMQNHRVVVQKNRKKYKKPHNRVIKPTVLSKLLILQMAEQDGLCFRKIKLNDLVVKLEGRAQTQLSLHAFLQRDQVRQQFKNINEQSVYFDGHEFNFTVKAGH